jgi:hypothetical protein
MPNNCTISRHIVQDEDSFIGTGYQAGTKVLSLCYYHSNKDKELLDTSSLQYLQKQRKIQMLQRIESIAQLEDNWNDYGAPAFSSKVIDRARSLVEDIPYKVKIFPTDRNTIQFEFDSIPGKYLEIEVFLDRYAVLYEKGATQEELDSVTRNEVLQKIADYHA